MNYEDFYQDLQPQEKNVKDGLASMQKLFKAVVREIDGGNYNEDALLANCYRNSLQLAAEHKIRRIAFPSISTGIYAFPVERAAKIAVRTVQQYLKENQDLFDVVLWVLFDDRTEAVYRETIEALKREA